MFAIAFDLTVADAKQQHPKGITQAYDDIAATLSPRFLACSRLTLHDPEEDMAKLFKAILALKALPWFALCVRDIRAFRVERWSDFTGVIKGT